MFGDLKKFRLMRKLCLDLQPDRAPIEALGNLDKTRIAKVEEIEKNERFK